MDKARGSRRTNTKSEVTALSPVRSVGRWYKWAVGVIGAVSVGIAVAISVVVGGMTTRELRDSVSDNLEDSRNVSVVAIGGLIRSHLDHGLPELLRDPLMELSNQLDEGVAVAELDVRWVCASLGVPADGHLGSALTTIEGGDLCAGQLDLSGAFSDGHFTEELQSGVNVATLWAEHGSDGLSPRVVGAFPVGTGDEAPLLALLVEFDPDEMVTPVLASRLAGKTTEAYLVDRAGNVLTHLRLGGQNQVLEELPVGLVATQPSGGLTPVPSNMLASVQGVWRGDPVTGVNAEGYRDYRGVMVVGAWGWIPDLNVGVVVEQDTAEALAPIARIRLMSITATFVVSLLVILAMWATSRAVAEWVKAVASTRRFRRVYESAPVALWEEDFSQVGVWLATLGITSPVELRQLLAENPALIDKAASLIDVKSMNPAAQALVDQENGKSLFGGDPEDPVSAEVRAAVVEQLVAILKGRTTVTVPIRGTTRSGTCSDSILHWRCETHESGTLDLTTVVVAVIDVSDLAGAERDLRAVIQSKDSLIASVSHELRTPLTGVVGYADILLVGHRDLPEEERESMLGIIARQAHELAYVVEDLVTAARIESGQVAVARVPVSLRGQVTQVIEGLLPETAALVHAELDSASAIADPARVRQIIRNLLNNAIKHGAPPVRVTSEERPGVLAITVTDRGDGIPTEWVDEIFEPYATFGGGGTQPSGLGLGLPIARRLAREMGGDVTHQRVGSETQFELTLPISLDQRIIKPRAA